MSKCRQCGTSLSIETFYAGDKPVCQECMMHILSASPNIREMLIKSIS